ncbi:MAG TPA: polysaccharide deacetylase family protein, partial [Candidatus Sulfopaludibacter sp.]|nr:polysaccharide deacetylase family protein [Candidatus Sulfopaludibacter sp.]
MKSGSQLAARAASWLPGGRALLRHAAGQFRPDAAPNFMLHRVLPDPRQCYHPEMVVSLATFEQFLTWLAGTYEVVPLEDLQSHLRAPRSRPACALTFDDGWLDTCVHAFPLLHRLRLPATVFLPLQFIGSERRFWQERLYYLLRRLRATGDGAGRLRRVGKEFAWCPDLGAEDLQYSQLARLLLRRASAEAEEFVARLSEAAGP